MIKRAFAVAVIALCCSASNANAGLLDGLWGGGGCGGGCGCEPACGCQQPTCGCEAHCEPRLRLPGRLLQFVPAGFRRLVAAAVQPSVQLVLRAVLLVRAAVPRSAELLCGH